MKLFLEIGLDVLYDDVCVVMKKVGVDVRDGEECVCFDFDLINEVIVSVLFEFILYV